MPRFQKLGFVALNVTDVERSVAFYRDSVGLTHSGTDANGVAFLRCGDEYHDLMLVPASSPGLKQIGWELESDSDFDELRALLDARAIPCDELTPGQCAGIHIDRALRVEDPSSRLSNIFYTRMWSYGGNPHVTTVAKIQRIGHVVVQVPDFAATLGFYHDVLGFEISDMFADAVVFLRAPPNPFHHSLAIGPTSGPARFHHVNFMVSEIDDVGRAFWRFQKEQVPVVHGPGRHPPSGSIFLYYLDPDGLTVEYSFGMEEFPEQGFRKPRRLEKVPSSMDYWGAAIDPRKGAIGEIENAAVPT